MPKYAVLLEGKGCLLRTQENLMGIFQRPRVKPMGFFTTRFVEAQTPQEAGKLAIELVRQEVATVLANEPNDVWQLFIDEVWEDIEQFDLRAPGAGCTWYEPKDN